MENHESKKRPDPKKTAHITRRAAEQQAGEWSGSDRELNASGRAGALRSVQSKKPLIDLNDLGGSADALRKLADQLDSLDGNRAHGNTGAYALPKGHFVTRVEEHNPPKKKAKQPHESSKNQHEDEEEGQGNDPSDDSAQAKNSSSHHSHDQNDENENEDEEQDQDDDQDDQPDEEGDERKDDPRKKVRSKKKSSSDSDEDDKEASHDEDSDSKKGGAKKKFKFTPGKIAALVVVVCILIGAAEMFFYHMHTYESTDDATVQAHTTLLAPKVSGIVTQVLVDEHQRVKAGQVLVKIETKDYDANLDNSRATLESMKVQLRNAKRDLDRARELVKEHAITAQDYDHALANYQELDRKTRAAMSDVDQSELNLAYTEIRAPTDGMIGRKSVEVGMNASAGTALMGFVQNDERWVIANFKETQLSSIKPGKKVKVEVDAISGRDFEGVVESISPSSGATFTLFPPDNATGNFTKVVQRVPVKIFLKNLSGTDIENLQAGLSAVVSVYKQSEGESIPARPFLSYQARIGQSLPEEHEQAQTLPQDSQKLNSAREAPLSKPAPSTQSARGE